MLTELRKSQQEAARKAEEARLQAEQEAARIAAEQKAEQERIERERAEAAERARLAAAQAVTTVQTFANTYVYGQCTWYVAGRRSVPSNWGNANTWYARAQAAGWSTGSVPAVGAIATTTAGAYGHVALVEAVSGDSVVVSEMNYYGNGGGWNIRSSRTAPASEFLYIY